MVKYDYEYDMNNNKKSLLDNFQYSFEDTSKLFCVTKPQFTK